MCEQVTHDEEDEEGRVITLPELKRFRTPSDTRGDGTDGVERSLSRGWMLTQRSSDLIDSENYDARIERAGMIDFWNWDLRQLRSRSLEVPPDWPFCALGFGQAAMWCKQP